MRKIIKIILSLIFLITISGCSPALKYFKDIAHINETNTDSISLQNIGDGSVLILTDKDDINFVTEYMSSLNLNVGDKGLITPTGNGININLNNETQGTIVHDNSLYYDNETYEILEISDESLPLDFFASLFDKKWGLGGIGGTADFQTLFQLPFDTIKRITINDNNGQKAYISGSIDFNGIIDLLQNIKVTRIDSNNHDDTEASKYIISLYIYEDENVKPFNLVISEKMLMLGSDYKYATSPDLYKSLLLISSK